MKPSILPKTVWGKWSVSLCAACILLFILAMVLSLLGREGRAGPVIGVAFGLSGMAALATGLTGTIRSKERSIIVFLAILIGLFVLAFLIGDLLVPQ